MGNPCVIYLCLPTEPSRRERISTQRYAPGARETLSLPAGAIEAIRVDRQRDDAKRTTTSWFAPQKAWLPVQIEQVEKGDTITMRLAASTHDESKPSRKMTSSGYWRSTAPMSRWPLAFLGNPR